MTSVLAALVLLAAAPSDELVAAIGAREVADEKVLETQTVTMVIEATELDKKGAAKDTSEITLRRSLKDGKPHDELVKYVENGKDVTAEKKKQKADREADEKEKKEGSEKGKEIRSPFHPDLVKNYAFEDLGADPKDAGRTRIRFVPKGDATGDDLMKGECTVSLADSRIREMTATPAVLPMLVQKVDMSFSFGDAGEILRLEMAGEGGALFVKKRFKMITKFAWELK